ncbi:YesL family protein [Alkalihalobacillus sp. 1P02AB]|uniref:YesL family protein n=1 Tax=Alkalihalobacillus sp. 1P02AB TaxID=3132260 RepID=UPI0039A4FDBB
MLNQGGFMGGFYRISEWIMRLAYINLLWIFFTLIGFVVFGWMPATVAMFTVIRRWFMGETDVSIFKLFFTTYKKEFIKANLLGVLVGVVGYILYIDFQFINHVSGVLQLILTFVFVMVGFFYFVAVAYLIPVFVHYDLKFFQYIKNAFLIGLLSPLMTIILVITLSLTYYVFWLVPGLIPVFGVSVFGCIMMGTAYFAFKRLETRKQKAQELKESTH